MEDISNHTIVNNNTSIPEVAKSQPVSSPLVQSDIDKFYADLDGDDSIPEATSPEAAKSPQTPTYRPEDLDMFEDMLNPDEFKYLLGTAAELNEPEKVEKLVESNPETAEMVIDDNSPLDIEAKQAIDGGADAEVNNDAVEDFIEEHNNSTTSDPLGTNKKGLLSEPNIDSFIKGVQEEDDKKFPATKAINDITAQIQTHPLRSIIEQKLNQMFTNYSRGKYSKAEASVTGFNGDWREGLNRNPELVADVMKKMKDPEALVRNSKGLALDQPELRQYCEEHFGHDWVKSQDRGRLLKDLGKRNLGIAKQALKYMDKFGSVMNPKTGKAYSNYEIVGLVAKGELDPKDVFKDKSGFNRNGKPVSTKTASLRAAARDALQEIKLNNEIRSYLSSVYDPYIDVSQLKGLKGIELRDALKEQIGNKVSANLQKDIEKEVDWLEDNEMSQDKGIDWDKLTADWYTERERLNKPDQTVKDEFGREIPDYEPIGDDPNYGKGAPGVMMHKDEDFAGSDELPAVINDGLPAEQYYDTSMYDFDWDWKDITPEHIISEVDNDDTIPKEEKDEVKRRRLNILGWSKGVNLGRVQNAKIEASKKELPKAGIKYGKAHNNMSILGNIGNATLSAKPISVEKRNSQQQSLPRTTASYSLGNKEDTTPKAVSMKNSAHQYGNEGAFARKGGMLGGRKKVGNIPMGKGMPMSNSTSPRSSGALRAPSDVAKEDMNILTLRDLIIKKSIKWPDRRLDKDGYLIVVRDNERVFVNKQLLENFTRDNPRKIKELRKIVQEN